MSRSLHWFALGVLLLTLDGVALGQTLPARPIRIVTGQAPGGHTDALARAVAGAMAELLQQPVVVENRAGAGGTIAAEAVARAPPDGCTLLLAGSSNLGLGLLVNKAVRYDGTAFQSIGAIARVPYALAVHQSVPATSVAELVAYARAHPGQLNFVTSGPGSTSSLGLELLRRAGGVDIVAVPYKGSAAAVSDFIGGQVQVMFTDASLLSALATGGAVRVLAAAARERLATAPSLPTVVEEGYPTLVIEPWYGLVAPAGTPPEAIELLSATLRESLRSADVRRQFERLGYVPLPSTAGDLDAIIEREVRTFQPLVEAERRGAR